MTEGFKIIGLSVRTTNRDNQSAKDISMLWQQFYSKHVFENIPNKISDDIYSVYTDYKSDYTEDYTTIVGVLVSTLSSIPDGFIGREFANENFKVFTAKGKMPNAVLNMWISIWQKDKELDRKYSYDYEVYGSKSHDEENAEVDIFISV